MPHPFDGPPTELLVLGSAHLTAETTDAALQTTLERLLAWQPQAVAVEALPGDVVQGYRLEGELYAGLRVGGYPAALRLEVEARKHRTWSRAEAEAGVAQGWIAGGMIPKVRAALDALQRGAPFATIASGMTDGVLAAAVRGEAGTRLTP